MNMNVKNIFCVGRNYSEHAHELNNAVPESPLLFTKPTHALVEANGQPIVLPGDRGEIRYEVELVVHIARKYEPGIRMEDLIDKMAIGIDLTLRDVQNELKEKGYPWVLGKGFINSAVVTPFIPFDGMEACMQQDFSLVKNGQEVQRGNIKGMIFDLPTVFAYAAKHIGLDQGDIFFTGTPAGVGPISDGDELVCKWGEKQLGSCIIKLDR